MIVSKIANGVETKLYDKKGVHKPIRALMSNALEIFTTDKGERIAALYANGKLRQAQKYSAEGDVVFIKKYINMNEKPALEILKPDKKDDFELKSAETKFLARI
jgi:hypothetical protein